ncbi:hypothetical protein L873DRAFT_1816699, partial [Choiromyces venosus 120613-1]
MPNTLIKITFLHMIPKQRNGIETLRSSPLMILPSGKLNSTMRENTQHYLNWYLAYWIQVTDLLPPPILILQP